MSESAVCRLELEVPSGSSNIVLRVDSKLKKYSVGDIWYPSEIIERGFRDDVPGKYEDRIIVTDAKFNIPIDPERFTVAALRPPPNLGIVRRYDSNQPSEEWDGQKVVPVTPIADRIVEAKLEPARRSWRIPLLIIGNILLVLVLAVWLIAVRKTQLPR